MKQQQFLDVVEEEVARERFRDLVSQITRREEAVAVSAALGRVLAADVAAPIDVPGFDRSNVDGFAVRARDTYGAEETAPRFLTLRGESLAAGDDPSGLELGAGEALSIATGGVLPRGSDAVVMVEYTHAEDAVLEVQRAVAPGAHVAWAGTDLGAGELVLRRGELLSFRETGLLAALGLREVSVFARPRVVVLSTGDELKAPGAALRLGQIYDSNAPMICDAVTEAGGLAENRGIVPDDEEALRAEVRRALLGDAGADLLILSGGTSKGAGDLNARVVADLAEETPGSAGIVVHGVALKPGKPLCMAGLGGKPVVILPGFPTSAIFTFTEFVAPWIRELAGLPPSEQRAIEALAPLRIPSVSGRTQYSLVNLVQGAAGIAAYPLGSGSGSVSTFAKADGFVRIPSQQEFLEAGERVRVRLLGGATRPADLIAIGSHCLGLDRLLGRLAARGFRVKAIPIGSQGGLAAIGRGEGDLAATHLLDPESGLYNAAFLPAGARLFKGYRRRQGIVFRPGDPRFSGLEGPELLAALCVPGARMVNRNQGSGTRQLLDALLAGQRPPGYEVQARSHHSVAAAVVQGRADWGMTLESLALDSGLAFVFHTHEELDFAIREDRLEAPAVKALMDLVRSPEGAAIIRGAGFEPIVAAGPE